MPSAGLPQKVTVNHTGHQPHRFTDVHFPRLLWTHCPGHARVKEIDRADRMSGKTTITNGLRHLKSEELRSLRHYLRAQSQELRTVGHLEVRGVERGSARLSFLKGRETTTISQTNTGTVSAATLGKLVRDGVERIKIMG